MSNIPVLTFHTVANHTDNRPWAFLSTSVSSFENTLKYLKKHNYQTLTLKELYEWKKKGVKDNIKRVLIHFDDGFLDNYTVAYPLLKKYGFKATVFVSPEFVDPRPIVRELQYENIINNKPVDIKNVWGYMSWEELKKVDSEGVIDVQAHAMTHTWYPSEPTFADWHHAGDSYYWLFWNRYPEIKPFWLTEYDETAVEFGTPVFKYAKSISGKKFIPHPHVEEFCKEYYNAHIDEYSAVLKDKKAKAEFISKFNAILEEKFGSDIGTYESDEDFTNRLRLELIESKKIDEERLGKKIEFLAWPGGAVSGEAYDIASEAGYLSWTKKGKPYNELSDDPVEIYRVGGWSGIKFNFNPNNFVEYWFLKMQLHRAKGDKNLFNRIYAKAGNIYRNRHIKKCRKNGEKWK